MRKYLPLLVITSLLVCFFYLRLYRYLSFESLAQHRNLLLQWKEENYLLAVSIYVLTYSLAVAASFPGALFLSLAGGLLFGPFPGTLYVLFSATLGSTLLFLSIKLALSDWFEKKAGKWIKQMEQGFRKNAFSYLLSLRLIPVFPFCLVNIIAGLLALPLSIFVSATFLGLIPGAVIYTSIGQNLGDLFELNNLTLLDLLLTPRFLLPLLSLAVLALLPIIFNKIKVRKTRR